MKHHIFRLPNLCSQKPVLRPLILAAMLGILCLAAAVRWHNIYLPGPYMDEMLFALAAKNLLAHIPSPGISGVTVFGIWFPLNANPNTGMLSVYLEALASLLTLGAPFIFRYTNVAYV